MEDIIAQGPLKTYVGELEVLYSGMMHTSPERPAYVQLNDLKVEFNFLDDQEDVSVRVLYSGDHPKTMAVSAYNFTNPLGEGILKPKRFGEYANRALYLTFFVRTPNILEGLRTIEFVFYIGEDYV